MTGQILLSLFSMMLL